jgi:hypothetical protein
MAIFETVIVSPLISPVNFTVWPACSCKAARSWLDCPVPRLTLLFFGAAEDVPEAAKMVTAGTALLRRYSL